MYSRRYDILIADSDPKLLDQLACLVRAFAGTCDQTSNGVEMLERVASRPPDLLVLDLDVPGWSQAELARMVDKYREQARRIRILALASPANPDDAMIACRRRWDDVLKRPVCAYDVAARIQGLLRRPGTPQAAVLCPAGFSIGRLTLDANNWEARFGATALPVTAPEFKLLCLLASFPARFFSSGVIADYLGQWGTKASATVIDERALGLVSKLHTLGCPGFIEVQPGRGYRLGCCD
ncbi:response regulator [Sphingomonas sp. R647]|uniref:response regulator n=1 Tax=Sphingomonas sp. R647 TaxID=2875233 RepID=UPI001CD38C32|nr:response regulator [Sphingomonas sp. R647]MCA1200136.1 response regulator [Sphingomonas sp. R647]